jgi:hypothetical protein
MQGHKSSVGRAPSPLAIARAKTTQVTTQQRSGKLFQLELEEPSLLRRRRRCGTDQINEMMMANKGHNARIDRCD